MTHCARCGNVKFIHDRDLRYLKDQYGTTIEQQYGVCPEFVLVCIIDE